jgi:hypothetical protein
MASEPPDRRPRTGANDAEREAQVTQIISRLDRLLAEANALRDEVARLKSGTPVGAAKDSAKDSA